MSQSAPKNKINIFPIEINIEGEGGPYKAQAYRINSQGMIMEVFVSKFKPQQSLKLKWTLPIDDIAMEEDAVVVKLYSQPKGNKIQYLMEIHFKKIKPQNAEAIKSLLDRVEHHKKQIEKKAQS